MVQLLASPLAPIELPTSHLLPIKRQIWLDNEQLIKYVTGPTKWIKLAHKILPHFQICCIITNDLFEAIKVKILPSIKNLIGS